MRWRRLRRRKVGILQIRTVPDEVLRQRAREVEDIDGEVVKLAEDMLETMYDAPGIGLAAPQVGRSIRLIVFDISHKEGEKEPYVLVNPVITASEGTEVMEEGCLSVPGIYAKVRRAAGVEVRGYDLDGKEVVMQADGLLARVIQHEIDHLDGVLFIDRLGRVRREMIMRKLMRQARG